MLIKITVENFKSFSEPTELTMISSAKIQKLPEHKVKIGSTGILKHAVIYGANAAGKSNLIDALRFVKATVSQGLPLEAAKWFCKTEEENINRESSFEIQFTIEKKFYAYGFTAVLSRRKITSEWLYELFQNGSSRRLFERSHGESRPVTGDIKMSKSDEARFTTYVQDFEGNESMLFLTEMNRNKRYSESSRLQFFQTVYKWITENIIIVSPDAPLADFRYYYDETTIDVINSLIKTFDSGIESISIEETDLEEVKRALPTEVFDYIMKEIGIRLTQSESPAEAKIAMRTSSNFFTISLDGDQPTVSTLKLRHQKSFYDFTFGEESDGTIRIFDLLDMLLVGDEDIVFAVDELERSLHPKLTEHFLELFSRLHKNRKVQLLFTTHEAVIMDQRLFRRDEIWFVERGGSGTSVVYPLDKFKERYDKALGKAYLEGRYGAIPVFSSFKFKGEEYGAR